MAEVIASYKVSTLLSEYELGTRQWMYDEVFAWLDSSVAVPASSRMFLLLAGAGMGKSVFSAALSSMLEVRTNRDPDLVLVQHFFKVGQRRSQCRAMVLCLAQQLAEHVEGYAAHLEPAVREHGDGSALPELQDVFEKFLLEPLVTLDQQRAKAGRGLRVLILLDALDESDDGGAGWQPCIRLVADQ